MSDRQKELLRQKALLDEQAAQLAREIAAEQARSGPAPAPAVPPVGSAPVPPATPAAAVAPADPVPAASDAEAEAIIDQYRNSPQTVRQQVTRGCILYFLGALALVVLAVVVIHVMAHRK